MTTIKGILTDPIQRRQFKGEIVIENGKIKEIRELDDVPDHHILPPLVDSHIHIESSMLVPSEFARLAVQHGTVATVSDPHEIANVCGIEGVEYMIENGNKVPLKFYFGAPSCVPATPFETAGAILDVDAVKELLERDEIHYLSEMMNWPGVLNDDPDVLAKIEAAHDLGKPVDGHAPGLKGEKAEKYASAGISTDHECFTKQEALDKIKAGMLISIREGSAAKNYDALIELLGEHPGKIMFCSDDKHPDDLIRGHMNEIVARTLKLGYNLFDTLHACAVLPVQHYNLNVGLLQPGDPADFIVVDSPGTMNVLQTWIDGKPVYQKGEILFPDVDSSVINRFEPYQLEPKNFKLYSEKSEQQIIVAEDGQLITQKETATLRSKNGEILADPDRDILKIAVINRYEKQPPAVGFIKNFGLKNGAIASSVAHDSHNIVAVGSSDEAICEAVNLVMESRGGISAVHGDQKDVLPLPVGGIMSNDSGEIVAKGYERLSKISREMGSTLKAPFMLISFMALLVIPSLKMSDKGLFDGEDFVFVEQ
ncbi:MAG: adenine deaminase [Bacteroidetes bacterium]|jgi:adenine deaminase|nr:adenine deaminase [Bacteroidota bacterium]